MKIFEKAKEKTLKNKRLTYIRDISQSKVVSIKPKQNKTNNIMMKETSLTSYFDNLKGLNMVGRIVFNDLYNHR